MKPAIFFNRNFVLACLSALFFLVQGCVTDDLSVCGISVHFRYTKNLDGVDKFASSVKKVNLYVFDAEGYFIQEYAVEKDSLPQDFTIYVNLTPGTYDLVAWGNLGDDYEVQAALEKGVTRIDDLQLSLKRLPGDSVMDTPEPLYHGSLFHTEILATDLQFNQTLIIDLMKDTKEVKVIASGLAVTKESKAGGTVYDCTITSRNGDYKFDNSITGEARLLQYIPQTSVDDENRLVSDFVVMREFNENGITGSRLILSRVPASPGDEGKELLNVDLRTYLLAATGDPANPADLDIWDKFRIELFFDETTGTVSISVNGWGDLEVINIIE
jgi:hypothetical protein